MRRLLDHLWAHRATIVVTIEVFWIIVFLLDAATRDMSAGTTGFVYANF